MQPPLPPVILSVMTSDRNAVERFLDTVGMHPDGIDLESTVLHMMKEMTRGLDGKPSSLAMIPTYIEVDAELPANKPVAVLDAGGTNLRAALVSFTKEGKPLIENFSKHPMPGTQGSVVGREEFFDAMAALVEPLVGRGGKIGFCFSYPTEIFPNRDGRLIHWSKEIQAPEVEGRLIGSDLREAFQNRGVSDPPDIVILNDTVATLLTGRTFDTGREWGGSVGFILGTGSNTCYVESNQEIRKAKGLDASGSQIINAETGNFACENRGEGDRRLGASTGKPNTYWLEKMLSGAYFGALVTHTAALAGEAGLFSPEAVGIVSEIGEISTKDANNYCRNPTDASENALVSGMKSAGESDSRRMWFLIDALLERGAKLSAANLAASVLKGPTAGGPLAPSRLAIDGTAYYRYYRFRHRVEHHLRPFLTGKNEYYQTVQVEDAPLIGAAVAALTN